MIKLYDKAAYAAAGFAALVAGCGGAGVNARYSSVHNAFSALGFSQTGPLHEGSLGRGEQARLTHHLSSGACTTFIAFGGDGVSDVQMRVLDDAGTEVATESTHDRQATLQFCPDRDADYVVVIKMEEGSGDYLLASWSGGISGGGGPRPGGARSGACNAPAAVRIGQPMQGNTSDGSSQLDPSCGRPGGNEQVYSLRLTERALVQAVVQASFDAVVYIRRDCNNAQSEVACNDDYPSGNTSRSEVSVALDPGTYFLVVDGYAGGSQGAYELIVSTSQVPELAQLCRDAEVLTPGRPAQGTTVGSIDSFTATCGGNARSGDRVYRVDVAQRSRLRVRSETTDHDGVVHVRSDCASASSEIGCDDDFIDNHHSIVTSVVNPGAYYVIADGYGGSANGPFTVQADLAPESGGGAAGDNCSAPQAATAGTTSVDTFAASDDFHGSCGGAGAPDVVHRLDIQRRSRVRVRFSRSEFNGVAYILQRNCEQGAHEMACAAFSRGNDNGGGGTPPSPVMGPQGMVPPSANRMVARPPTTTGAFIDTVLAPGTYYVVVDGSQADSFGATQMDVVIDDPEAAARACREAPLLVSGRSVTASTQGRENRFEASCTTDAQAADMLYRIQLRQRSLVRLNLQGVGFDTVLHLRRDCGEASSEVACNDDDGESSHSRIETTLDPGTYYVIVDGFNRGAAGDFTLTYDSYRADGAAR